MNDRRSQFITLLFFASIAVLFFGFSWLSAADGQGYLDIYSQTPKLVDFTYEKIRYIHGEIGFLFSIAVFKQLFISDYIFLFVFSLISLSCKAIFFYKESKLPALAFGFYLLLLSLTYELIQIRFGFAVGFMLLAFSLYHRKRVKWAIAVVIFSASFHYFSLVGLLLLLSSKIKLKNWAAFLITLVLFSIFSRLELENLFSLLLGNGTIIERRILGYISGDSEFSKSVSFTSVLVIRFYTLLFLMILVEKLFIKTDGKFSFYVHMCTKGALIFSPLSFNAIMFGRATAILEIMLILTLSITIANLKTLRQKLLMAFAFLSFFYMFYFHAENASSVFEYNTWLPLLLH